MWSHQHDKSIQTWWVGVGNGIEAKLGCKDLGFDYLGSIKLVRYRDFGNVGMIRWLVSWYACLLGGGGGLPDKFWQTILDCVWLRGSLVASTSPRKVLWWCWPSQLCCLPFWNMYQCPRKCCGEWFVLTILGIDVLLSMFRGSVGLQSILVIYNEFSVFRVGWAGFLTSLGFRLCNRAWQPYGICGWEGWGSHIGVQGTVVYIYRDCTTGSKQWMPVSLD